MKKYFFIFIVAFFASCSPVEQDVIITIDTETVLNDCYIGNGAQWDPYQLDYGKGKLTISEADWENLLPNLAAEQSFLTSFAVRKRGRLLPIFGVRSLFAGLSATIFSLCKNLKNSRIHEIFRESVLGRLPASFKLFKYFSISSVFTSVTATGDIAATNWLMSLR